MIEPNDRVFIIPEVIAGLLNNPNFSDVYFELMMCQYWKVNQAGYYQANMRSDLLNYYRPPCRNNHCLHNKCVQELLLYPIAEDGYEIYSSNTKPIQLADGMVKKHPTGDPVKDKIENVDYLVRAHACPFCFDKDIYARLKLSNNRKFITCSERSNHDLMINLDTGMAFIDDREHKNQISYGYDFRNKIVRPYKIKGKLTKWPKFSAPVIDIHKMYRRIDLLKALI